MAGLTPNGLAEILTTTLSNYSGQIADGVSNNNALLLWLSKKGNIRPVEGGVDILQEMAYQENSASKWYTGYDPLTTSSDNVLTHSHYDYAQCAVTVAISGLEMLQNSDSRWRIHDLLKSRVEVAQNTLKNLVSTALYSDGSADGGKQLVGLKTAVPDDPTSGTFGGITRTSGSFWSTNVYNFTTLGSVAGPTTIQPAMNQLAMKCVRGTDSPDLWIMDNVYFGHFLGSLQAIQMLTDPNKGSAGFAQVAYYGAGKQADVVLDGGHGGAATASHAWALNTDYIFFRPHKDRNFVPLDPDRYSTNQDALIRIIGFAGALTMSCAFVHGVLTT